MECTDCIPSFVPGNDAAPEAAPAPAGGSAPFLRSLPGRSSRFCPKFRIWWKRALARHRGSA